MQAEQRVGRLCPVCGELTYGECCRVGGKNPTPRRLANLEVWRSPLWKKLKRQAHERDDWTCVDCGHRDPTGLTLVADHDMPFEGPDDPLAWERDNVSTRCLSCSGRKDGGRR